MLLPFRCHSDENVPEKKKWTLHSFMKPVHKVSRFCILIHWVNSFRRLLTCLNGKVRQSKLPLLEMIQCYRKRVGYNEVIELQAIVKKNRL
ncbi:hypothetical protein DQX05_15525 [Paenibacillus thiaminolyticus]|uniref:Uncharacterized protein n=1 Tax=Paenibacillus thiaminolyticus TaxID=49283 RepID=A0A3A3GGC5_PANTH|nr:hypothetical protein DQX05_15525 [Paenibacillus thiaminolyticus]